MPSPENVENRKYLPLESLLSGAWDIKQGRGLGGQVFTVTYDDPLRVCPGTLLVPA
jgi:hypothetical protein